MQNVGRKPWWVHNMLISHHACSRTLQEIQAESLERIIKTWPINYNKCAEMTRETYQVNLRLRPPTFVNITKTIATTNTNTLSVNTEEDLSRIEMNTTPSKNKNLSQKTGASYNSDMHHFIRMSTAIIPRRVSKPLTISLSSHHTRHAR